MVGGWDFPLERKKFSEIGKYFRKWGRRSRRFPLDKTFLSYIVFSSSFIFMFSPSCILKIKEHYPQNNMFSFQSTNLKDVIKEIQGLDVSKSAPFQSVPARVIKDIADVLCMICLTIWGLLGHWFDFDCYEVERVWCWGNYEVKRVSFVGFFFVLFAYLFIFLVCSSLFSYSQYLFNREVDWSKRLDVAKNVLRSMYQSFRALTKVHEEWYVKYH